MSEIATPVVLLIFNRPDTTSVVVNAIRRANPSQLFVIADGPRPARDDDARRCEEARNVVDHLAWNCDVRRDYADTNLGCKARVSSGLDWVFGQVERAIILEDDCLPHPTFFPYCDELIERYEHDERMSAISGNNLLFGRSRSTASYYFSLYPHSWGWATWRRAWAYYDGELRRWPELREGNWLHDILADPYAEDYWRSIFDRARDGRFDSWAYPWLLSCWAQGGLGICPRVNLVSHIGGRADATHVRSAGPVENLPVEPIQTPLVHPELVIPDRDAARFTARHVFRPTRRRRVARLVKRWSPAHR